MPFRSKAPEKKQRELVPVRRDILEKVVGGRGENGVDRPEDAILIEQTMIDDPVESGSVLPAEARSEPPAAPPTPPPTEDKAVSEPGAGTRAETPSARIAPDQANGFDVNARGGSDQQDATPSTIDGRDAEPTAVAAVEETRGSPASTGTATPTLASPDEADVTRDPVEPDHTAASSEPPIVAGETGTGGDARADGASADTPKTGESGDRAPTSAADVDAAPAPDVSPETAEDKSPAAQKAQEEQLAALRTDIENGPAGEDRASTSAATSDSVTASHDLVDGPPPVMAALPPSDGAVLTTGEDIANSLKNGGMRAQAITADVEVIKAQQSLDGVASKLWMAANSVINPFVVSGGMSLSATEANAAEAAALLKARADGGNASAAALLQTLESLQSQFAEAKTKLGQAQTAFKKASTVSGTDKLATSEPLADPFAAEQRAKTALAEAKAGGDPDKIKTAQSEVDRTAMPDSKEGKIAWLNDKVEVGKNKIIAVATILKAIETRLEIIRAEKAGLEPRLVKNIAHQDALLTKHAATIDSFLAAADKEFSEVRRDMRGLIAKIGEHMSEEKMLTIYKQALSGSLAQAQQDVVRGQIFVKAVELSSDGTVDPQVLQDQIADAEKKQDEANKRLEEEKRSAQAAATETAAKLETESATRTQLDAASAERAKVDPLYAEKLAKLDERERSYKAVADFQAGRMSEVAELIKIHGAAKAMLSEDLAKSWQNAGAKENWARIIYAPYSYGEQAELEYRLGLYDSDESPEKFNDYRLGISAANSAFKQLHSVATLEMDAVKTYFSSQQSMQWAQDMLKQVADERAALKLGDTATAELHESRYERAFDEAAKLRSDLSASLKEVSASAGKVKGLETKVEQTKTALSETIAKTSSDEEIAAKKSEYQAAIKEHAVAKQQHTTEVAVAGQLSQQLKTILVEQTEAEAARHHAAVPALAAAHDAAKAAVEQQWHSIAKAIAPADADPASVFKLKQTLSSTFGSNLEALRSIGDGEPGSGDADRMRFTDDFRAALATKASAETAKLLKLMDAAETAGKAYQETDAAAKAAEKLAGTTPDKIDPAESLARAEVAAKAKDALLEPGLGKIDTGAKDALKDTEKREGAKASLERDLENHKRDLYQRAEAMKADLYNPKYGLHFDPKKHDARATISFDPTQKGTLAYDQHVRAAVDDARDAAWREFSKPWRDLGIDTGVAETAKTETIAAMTDSEAILSLAESKSVKVKFTAFEGVDAAKLAAAKQQVETLKPYETREAAQRALDSEANAVKAKLVAGAQQDAATARNALAEAKAALAATDPADTAARAAAESKVATATTHLAKQEQVVASMEGLSGTTEIMAKTQSIASHGSSGEGGELLTKLKQALDHGDEGQRTALVVEAKALLTDQAQKEASAFKQPAEELQRAVDGLQSQLGERWSALATKVDGGHRVINQIIEQINDPAEIRALLDTGTLNHHGWSGSHGSKNFLESAARNEPADVEKIFELMSQLGDKTAALKTAGAAAAEAETKGQAIAALNDPGEVLRALSDTLAANGGEQLRSAAQQNAATLAELGDAVASAAAALPPGAGMETVRAEYDAAKKTIALLDPLEGARSAHLHASQDVLNALAAENAAIERESEAYTDATQRAAELKETYARTAEFLANAKTAVAEPKPATVDPVKAAEEGMKAPASEKFQEKTSGIAPTSYEEKATEEGTKVTEKTSADRDDAKMKSDAIEKLKKTFTDKNEIGANIKKAALGNLDKYLQDSAADLAKRNGTMKAAVFDRVLASDVSSAADGHGTVTSLGKAAIKARAEAYHSDTYAAASASLSLEAGAAHTREDELGGGLIGTAALSIYAKGALGAEAKAVSTYLGLAADASVKASLHASGSASSGISDGEHGIETGVSGIADTSATGKAGAKIGVDGGSVKLSASAEASVRANFFTKVKLGELNFKDEIRAYAVAKAEATFDTSANLGEVKAKVGAWAGAAAGIEQTRTIKVWGVTVEGTAGIQAGALGASAGVEIGYKAGKLTLGVNIGAALGVGVHANLSITIDFVELLGAAEDALKQLAVNEVDRENISVVAAYFKILSGGQAFMS